MRSAQRGITSASIPDPHSGDLSHGYSTDLSPCAQKSGSIFHVGNDPDEITKPINTEVFDHM